MIKTRPNTYEIINVSVIKKYQGNGIGKQLVKNAIELCKIKGAHTIEIGTGNSSVNQLALYQKCGFRIVSIDFDYFLKNCTEKLFENGIQCRDMIRLSMDI